MQNEIERMEEERSWMIVEFEGHIERVSTDLTVDVNESDYGGSRPTSILSTPSATSTGAGGTASPGAHGYTSCPAYTRV